MPIRWLPPPPPPPARLAIAGSGGATSKEWDDYEGKCLYGKDCWTEGCPYSHPWHVSEASTASTKSERAPILLFVTGASAEHLNVAVEGIYTYYGDNHLHPTFAKPPGAGTPGTFCYFWDGRDGPSLTGWWISDSVGRSTALARHHDADWYLPPEKGWCAPIVGPIDNSFRIHLLEEVRLPQGDIEVRRLSEDSRHR